MNKFCVIIEALTLVMLWACTIYLYATTPELSVVHLLTGVVMSIGSIGTGFICWYMIKEWKKL